MTVAPNLDRLLELSNGLWTIVSVSLVIFLSYHLIKVSILRKITFRMWFFRLPLSMQLALGILIVALGIAMRSGQVWVDRLLHAGELSPSFGTHTFVFGTLVAVTGFMCILRVLTRPMLGNWPWVVTTLVMVAYILFWASSL